MSDEDGSAADGFVGDGRRKHVTVDTAGGERHEHGDVYLRHSVDAFEVSPDFEFPAAETTRYEKADLAHVAVTQHHSACFVTTAAAGEGETLDALRSFRDGTMRRTPVGRALVGVYEAVSPPVAATLADHPDARTTRVVRWLVDRCATLVRVREARTTPLARDALAVALTLCYVVGVCVALAGHAAIRGRARLGRISRGRTARRSRGG
ncbi:CFI-box-CTERM domain-containing protein [Halomarina pelagica]|uniref:CFI-box-CTERM domain-containing protein n=1 Tax=Halomarina pelagica TaxID=2961599 RepID=UPI0020C39B7A|nr:CFI-box-CTERM domain-containing protein [Halomarina sp. BND7]